MKKIIIFIIIFLLIGAYIITKQGNYNIKNSQEDRTSFLKSFSKWIVHLGRNMAEITGLAQKQKWMPREYNETDTLK